MFLDFLLFAVSMIFTQIYCSFAIATPLICIRVGIPITKLLQKNNLIHDTNGLMKQYTFCIVFWVIINSIVAFLVLRYVPSFYHYAILLSLILFLVRSFRETGLTPTNINEYLENNSCLIPDEYIESVSEYLYHHFSI